MWLNLYCKMANCLLKSDWNVTEGAWMFTERPLKNYWKLNAITKRDCESIPKDDWMTGFHYCTLFSWKKLTPSSDMKQQNHFQSHF